MGKEHRVALMEQRILLAHHAYRQVKPFHKILIYQREETNALWLQRLPADREEAESISGHCDGVSTEAKQQNRVRCSMAVHLDKSQLSAMSTSGIGAPGGGYASASLATALYHYVIAAAGHSVC